MSLYMGPMNLYEECKTCGNTFKECPGHRGYVDLPIGYFHPLL